MEYTVKIKKNHFEKISKSLTEGEGEAFKTKSRYYNLLAADEEYKKLKEEKSKLDYVLKHKFIHKLHKRWEIVILKFSRMKIN